MEEINFKLTVDDQKEKMITVINGKTFKIDFTSDNQSSLRDLFNECFLKISTDEFIFKFEDDSSVKNDTIIKAAKDFIDELNKEISNCYKQMIDPTEEVKIS